jgi:exonuclease III
MPSYQPDAHPYEVLLASENPHETAYQIMHINIRGIRSKMDHLGAITIEASVAPDIIAICETKLPMDRQPPPLTNYIVHANNLRDRTAGTAIYIRSDIPHEPIQPPRIHPSLQGRAIGVKMQDMTVIEAYAPSSNVTQAERNEFFDELSAWLTKVQTDDPQPLTVMGDFNAHIAGFAATNSDAAGKALQDLAHRNKIYLAPNNTPTFTQNDRESTCIDYVL